MKKVNEESDDSDIQEVIDDEDLELAAQIEKERKAKRAQKLQEKREKAGKPPAKKRTPAKKRPAPKRRRAATSSDEEDDDDDDEEDESPRKSSKKKQEKSRRRRQASSSDEEEEEEERSSRRKSVKDKKKRQESSEDEEEEEEKPKKKKKVDSKKKKMDSDDDEDSDAPKKKKKASSQKNKKKKVSSESESSEQSESEDSEEERKKKKKDKKKRKKVSESDESDEAPKKKKKPDSRRGKKEASESDDEEESEEEEKPKKRVKKESKKRKHAKTSSGEEDEDSESEENKNSESDSGDVIISPKKGKKSAVVDENSEVSDVEVMPKPKKRGAVLVSDSEEEDEKKKKPSKKSESEDSEDDRKTRRAKKVETSEEEESSDGSIEENRSSRRRRSSKPEKKKKGMIMDSADLAKETVDAEKAEKERRKRLEKKQKEFNGIVLEEGEDLTEMLTGTSSQRKLKSVVVDPDASGDPKCPVEVHSSLVRILKPHQAHGIQFMYDCAFESLDRLDTEGSGGILAHCMGLGKTLQVITFLHTVMMHEKIEDKCRRVLVVVPKNVIINWFKEFQKWLVDNDEELDTIEVNELDSYKTVEERRRVLAAWHKSKVPSVMIIGYDMFRILTCEDDPKKKKTKMMKKMARAKEDFRKYLQNPGPDLIVCDEAHKLKNDDSALSKCMVKIATKRRICLTGTPLQNNLMEYHCMVNFVKPGLLGTKTEFANRFVNIINRGRTKDASALEVSFMKRRCHVLYDHLKKCVDRKDYRVLTEAIPPKQEYVINVRMTERQCALYNAFLNDIVGNTGLSKRLLPDYHMFSRIWTHPYQLVLHEQRMELQRMMKEDAEEEEDFIDDDDDDESDESEVSLSSDSAESFIASDDDDDSKTKYMKKKNKKKLEERKQKASTSTARATRRRGDDDEDGEDTAMNILQDGIRASRRLAGEDADLRDTETPPEYTGWFSKMGLISEDDRDNFELSNKLVLLMEIIKKCEEIGDKLLVFSQSLESLALIKRMLETQAGTGQWFADGHEALNAEGETWSWLEGEDYLTIDGSVQSGKRDAVQTHFNDPENFRARLMLISTRAGSLGTNMVAANRVVIFDACWNPSHDTQSLFRVYRFGQKKPVYIYRFIAQGTMEERIYKRQVTKESTAMRVVDEAQIQRHYLGNDLTELYQFTPSEYDPDVEISCAPPKDRLLADIIHQNQFAVVDYIEHDTLFANVDDEQLTEQERKDAWNDYEKDKAGLPTGRGPALSYDNNAIRALMMARNNGIIVGNDVLPALQNQYQEGLRMEQLQHDVLFKELNKMRQKDVGTSLKIVLLRNLLDQILPHIPLEMRGGMSEFNTHFIRLVHESERRNETPADLLRKSLESFRTVIKMVRPIPSCVEPLNRMTRAYPYLFTQ